MEQIMPKTGYLTFEQFHGKQDIGSSRIRARWICEKLEGAELFCVGKKYDAVVFQKVYWPEFAEKYEGKKVLDICDADFLHWGYRIKKMINLMDAVTVSTQPLKDYLSKHTDKPIHLIPDCVNFDKIGDLKKNHEGNGKTNTVVWYGYSENFPMLDSAVYALTQCGVRNLIVVANRRSPYKLPVSVENDITLVNIPWTEETVYKDLLKADVIINPQSKKGRWKYKSNNKTILAWALGIPVAHTKNELDLLMTEEQRIEESEKRYKQVREEYNINKAAGQWRDILCSL